MNAVDSINKPHSKIVSNEALITIPNWMHHIAGYIECLSLSEAKDVLRLLLPNASVSLENKSSVVAIKNNIKFEIKATGMRHDWSEEHSSDCIEINGYYCKKKEISRRYELQNVSSITDILIDCRFGSI